MFKRNEKTQNKTRAFNVKEKCELLNFLLTIPGYSRNNIKSLLSRKQVLVNDVPVSQFDFVVYRGDEIKITPFMNKRVTATRGSRLKVIFENDEIIVINKPSGLLTIATDKEKVHTAYRLVNEHVQASDKNARIFIVHRLDQDTSGVLMFAKSVEIQNAFQKVWNDIVTKRGYFAIIKGCPKEEKGVIKSYLHKSKTNEMYSGHRTKTGKFAETHYQVTKKGEIYSLLDINILTGRKNQIRVHLKDLGFPILGDKKYDGEKSPIQRLCLHAYELKIKHPISGKLLNFKANPPKEFNEVVK
ncbi:MAG: RluA family pseudouridine synthase [Bacilli bacterium]|nr:RluA family pseudouridine synthase [Bacilli bacterium]